MASPVDPKMMIAIISVISIVVIFGAILGGYYMLRNRRLKDLAFRQSTGISPGDQPSIRKDDSPSQLESASPSRLVCKTQDILNDEDIIVLEQQYHPGQKFDIFSRRGLDAKQAKADEDAVQSEGSDEEGGNNKEQRLDSSFDRQVTASKFSNGATSGNDWNKQDDPQEMLHPDLKLRRPKQPSIEHLD
ncbi:hypothetical protein FGO68_gene5445 [Halteria grandinella]|uniref:Uncharacterized protein n=1 Tax=Halteria grandinella TaxID=5974 RepID=A0A8J8P9E3_HALGN|nr:hypothetical protein FGO68_gene5445 [Halteria grandinella]